MQIIAIVNQKGGVGKTTTAVNLAASLAILGKRVLALDLDPQSNLTQHFGIDNEGQVELSMEDVMMRPEVDMVDILWKPEAPQLAELRIAPAELTLSQVERRLVAQAFAEKILARKMRSIRDIFDYVLIDCPPSVGLLTFNALVAADQVLMPVDIGVFSLKGIKQLQAVLAEARLENPKADVSGVLITRVRRQIKHARERVTEAVTARFGKMVYNTEIPENVALMEASAACEPVISYAPRSAGAKAYKTLAKEFLLRQPGGEG